jgi:mannose-6-phosphate isomerase-like protein (cupin superfamily)
MTNRNFYHLGELESRQRGKPYLEFLRIAAMSAGIYVLSPGEADRPSPHREDELYYLVAGKAHMVVGGEKRTVGSGSIIFVPAGVEHRFSEITEELVALVCFAPAESP